MSQIKSIGIVSIIAVSVMVLAAGCSKSDNIFNPETGKHAANWADPGVHGASAMAPAGSSGGLSTCQECHGTDFSGGISSIACSSCHGGNAPHPVSWTTGTRKHSSTDQSNAEVCAVCHLNGANSPLHRRFRRLLQAQRRVASTIPSAMVRPATLPAGMTRPNTALQQNRRRAALSWQDSAAARPATVPISPVWAQRSACLNTAGCHGAGVTHRIRRGRRAPAPEACGTHGYRYR